ALCETCGEKEVGEVYLISDPPAGSSAAADLAVARISGTLDAELERAALADAGDMNADGFRDIAIGAPESAGGPGAAYIFLGGQASEATLADAAAGLSPAPTALPLG